jgi:hypothetical protein
LHIAAAAARLRTRRHRTIGHTTVRLDDVCNPASLRADGVRGGRFGALAAYRPLSERLEIIQSAEKACLT